MKRYFFLVLILFLPIFVFSQEKHTINGYVTDEANGEKLIGASIYLPSLKIGTVTNAYGFYSLTFLASDSINIRISYVGYQSVFVAKPAAAGSLRLDIRLKSGQTLKEVEIVAESWEEEIASPQMSYHDVSIEANKKAPAMLGETDPIKTLQLLPGIKGGTEGSAGLYVRGGGPDQNLILLDGVPVYNPFHLFGFMSVFNSEAINDIKMFKGGIPARYGGRLSSVLDISMKEGDSEKARADWSLSPIAGSFTYQKPLLKDKAALIVSARRTWHDAVLKTGKVLFSQSDADNGYNLYDINIKANAKLNANNRLYASFYSGKDRMFFNIKGSTPSRFHLRWGNDIGVLRWNKIWGPKTFSNLAVSYSSFNYRQHFDFLAKNVKTVYDVNSSMKDLSAKLDFDYSPSWRHSVRFGGRAARMSFNPEVYRNNFSGSDTTFSAAPGVNAWAFEGYAEDEIKLSPGITANAGLRFSSFIVKGKTYAKPEPRLALNWATGPLSSIKASYTSMNQYIHLLSNSSIGLPTDLWVSATDKTAPSRSWQAALGYSKRLMRQKLNLSAEAYYKQMHGLVQYKEGSSMFGLNNADWETKTVSGKGDAYGAEFFVGKPQGRLNGWAGYTLSWANRRFAGINSGEVFPYKYDSRHDFSLLANYQVKTRHSLSVAFVYRTGNVITLPIGEFMASGPPLPDSQEGGLEPQSYVGSFNNFRMPAYHRLDVSYTIERREKEGKRGRGMWVFSVYNAYNRLNPMFIYESKGRLVQFTMFPVIPSVAYKWRLGK